jgi:putative heme-binding domain-containing protein
VAVELFAGRSSVPDEAIALLGTVAASDTETPSVRAKAIRALQRSGANPAALDAAVEALASAGEKPPGELAGAWEDFARDPAHGRRLAYFTKLAETDAPAKQLLGYGVLLHLAGQRMASKEAKAGAARVVDQAWARPGATIALLEAIARVRSDQYAHQIRALLTDPRPEVQKAATRAADRLGLKARGEAGSDQALIESLPYEQVVAAATGEKGEAKAGRELFLKQGCVACHTVSPDEAPKGPFLGGIATRYSRAELCESILNPNAKIAQGFETQWFTTKDGEEIEGFVTREAGEELDLRNIAGITTTLAKRDIKDRGKRETSMMPPDLAGKLAPRELASLLAYLESLKSK